MTHPHINLRVIFGRNHGEKTLGEVVKFNPSRAKVRTLENRGDGRGSVVGATWTVPYSLMKTEDGRQVNQFGPVPISHTPTANELAELLQRGSSTPPAAPVFTPNVWDNVEHNIVEAICGVYSDLSPESLTADGERSNSEMRAIKTQCDRRLRGLFMALNFHLDETQAYEALKAYEAATLPARR